ncbi:MAG: alpha-amylase family glycosyl hydrolase [Bacteroidales bacterium]
MFKTGFTGQSIVRQPDWSYPAAMYEVNVRQFSAGGDFQGLTGELPRLKAMGIDVLWLMPVHPIGIVNRKGALGSPYAIQDHFALDPALGNKKSFAELINRAHHLGMKVLLDWVANHTAPDHELAQHHPELFMQKRDGSPSAPLWTGWDDVVMLNYSKPQVAGYMIKAMNYWLEKFGVDGFRCDAAGFVPVSFWKEARRQLEKKREIYLLAEWEEPGFVRKVFNAGYGWSFYESLLYAVKHHDTGRLKEYFAHDRYAYPAGAHRLCFIDNHDKNCWEQPAGERFGEALKMALAFMIVAGDMPLIYNGLECGGGQHLPLFEKSPVDWNDKPLEGLITGLLNLKHRNRALWNGAAGGKPEPVPGRFPKEVIALKREMAGHAVQAVFNFSPDSVVIEPDEKVMSTSVWQPVRNIGSSDLSADGRLKELPGWGYIVQEAISR